ncbi:PRKCI [Cordylochernes scorpioides]|uniref:PRKCI n=1 Tax=Cordylochernes scorpioides TaxID=51811 RepID=A0ABY6KRE3_9ARAC|nr:PRKCI [Cordylochernes scorpioides]
MGKLNSRNQLKEARPERIRLPNALRKSFNRFRRMHRLKNSQYQNYARYYSAEAIIALNFLHTHGIIHRDVKLENILLNNDGHIKLADYGTCSEEGPDQNYRVMLERNDLDYNKAVDFWAIGTVIFELLLGFHPFLPQETCENENNYIKEAIIHKPIEIPRYLSYRAYSILRAFL